jgi:hypothetical protein
MTDGYKTYTCSYPHAGSRWSFDLKATSAEDAQARLDAIRDWGKLDGEVHLSIYVPDPRGPWRFVRRLLGLARAGYRGRSHRASPR